MKKYEQLESKIQELQKEVERLKQEEETDNKLPRGFVFDAVKKVIAGDINDLGGAFNWHKTPQGYGYWYNIFCKNKPLTDKAIIQLQKWVIIYLEQNQK